MTASAPVTEPSTVARDVLARLDPADLALAAGAAQNAMAAAAADATNARLEFQRYENLGRASPSFLASEREKRVAANMVANARLAQAQRQYALALSQQNYGTLYADADGVEVGLRALLDPDGGHVSSPGSWWSCRSSGGTRPR